MSRGYMIITDLIHISDSTPLIGEHNAEILNKSTDEFISSNCL